jgi:hypothetical protein
MNTYFTLKKFLLETSGIEMTFQAFATRIGSLKTLGIRGMNAERI